MRKDRTDTLAIAMLGLVILFWAGNSIVGRAVRFDIPPGTLAFGRWTLAFLLVLPFAAVPIVRERAAILRHWKWIVALGVLGVGAFNTFLYHGLRHTTAANALLLQAAIPAAVVLLDRLIFGMKADRWHVAGVVFSILGVMAIVFKGDPASALVLHFGTGDLLVLCSVAAWSIYTVLLRRRPPIALVSFVALTFGVGALVNAPLAFAEWHAGETPVWSPVVIAAFAYVALLPSLAAYFIYNWAVARIGPARAGQAITLMPLFGALLSALLLGETLHAYHLAGMALILLGIVTGTLGMRLKTSLA